MELYNEALRLCESHSGYIMDLSKVLNHTHIIDPQPIITPNQWTPTENELMSVVVLSPFILAAAPVVVLSPFILAQLHLSLSCPHSSLQLHLSAGNMDACQQQCVVLLKHDPDNEEAAVMLAELMFHKVSGAAAGFGAGDHT